MNFLAAIGVLLAFVSVPSLCMLVPTAGQCDIKARWGVSLGSDTSRGPHEGVPAGSSRLLESDGDEGVPLCKNVSSPLPGNFWLTSCAAATCTGGSSCLPDKWTSDGGTCKCQ